jgi:hypothetical protein
MYCELWSCLTFFGEPTETLPDPLADRLERLKACGVAIGMDADAFGTAGVDGDEHARLAFAGDCRGQVGAPHRICVSLD